MGMGGSEDIARRSCIGTVSFPVMIVIEGKDPRGDGQSKRIRLSNYERGRQTNGRVIEIPKKYPSWNLIMVLSTLAM